MLAVLAMAFAAIVVRLTYIQVVARERYAAVGETQRVHGIDLPAARGAIFDREGRELAMTVRQPTIAANPRLVTDPAGAAEALAPILGVDRAVLQHRLSRDAGFVYLARTVPEAVADRIKALDLDGLLFLDEPKRFSPAGDLAAPLLGRVGVDNEGLSGLELQFERRLAGRPGRLVVEQDPGGRQIPGGLRSHTPSARGDDLVLTIDRSLQYEVERALAARIVESQAKGGVAMVMESGTGELLAVANLVAGEAGGPPRPAPSNTAVTNVYEPGSVNKLITIAGALEEGLVRPDDRLPVAGTIRVADHVFKEHDPHPTVDWSVTDIMANSSNVGAIMIGQKLGKDRLDAYLRAFGFGETTGLGFPGESGGIMLDPRRWSGTSIGTIPIGQGISVTAMQILAAYNAVANRGEYVAPKLVRATVDTAGRERPTPSSPRRRVISAKTADEITGMLNEVVRVGTGTLAAIDGYTVAGKTGTARKPREGARGYLEGAYVASFAGFVPAERPAFTAIVLLDEPTPIYGGLVAAPVFADVSGYALRHFRVPPPPPARRLPTVPPVAPEAARGIGEPDPLTGRDRPGVPTTTLAPSPPAPRR
jgi:cell division protein FtsI (penicillin-binding protein 3)